MGTDGVFAAEPVSNVIGGSLCFITMLILVLPELKRMSSRSNIFESSEKDRKIFTETVWQISSCFYLPYIQYDASTDNLMHWSPGAPHSVGAYLLSIPVSLSRRLQGLSLGKESMYISMTRQAILPLVFLLKFGNLNRYGRLCPG